MGLWTGGGILLAGALCLLPGPSPPGQCWGAVLSAHKLQQRHLQAVVPITSRVWLQVITPAASGSPCLVLQTGHKSPGRSSYKVSIHGPPKRKQAQTPNVCPGQPPREGTRGFFSRSSELSGQSTPLLIASAGLQMQLILAGGEILFWGNKPSTALGAVAWLQASPFPAHR